MFKSASTFDVPPVLTPSAAASGVETEPDLSTGHPELDDIVERIFLRIPVVAVIGSGAAARSVCEDIAAEQGLRGRRVVLVSVEALLHPGQHAFPTTAACGKGSARNVWLWPSPAGQHTGAPGTMASEAPESWLGELRGNFDSVILHCPTSETAPGSVAISAMADSAVLAITAGALKRRVRQDLRTLQLSGVKLAGSILIKAR